MNIGSTELSVLVMFILGMAIGLWAGYKWGHTAGVQQANRKVRQWAEDTLSQMVFKGEITSKEYQEILDGEQQAEEG